MYQLLLALSVFIFTNTDVFAKTESASFTQLFQEQKYDAVKTQLLISKNNKINFLNADLADIAFDVLWDLNNEGIKSNLSITNDELEKLNLTQKLKFLALNRATTLQADSLFLETKIVESLEAGEGEERDFIYIASYRNFLPKSILIAAKKNNEESVSQTLNIINDNSFISKEEIKELFDYRQPLMMSENSEYNDKLKVFVFCRRQRVYPCRMLIKDNKGEILKDNNGDTFNLSILAKSSRDLPSNIRNGQTPQGIHTIDSVMPYANAQTFYGKYRRVILNFVKNTQEEELTKDFLPESQHEKLWWKKASVARDVNREFLRIHGTGGTSQADRPYYPHVPTSGCMSTREGIYNEVEYHDQRIVLDALMRANDLDQNYDNETSIKGHLVVLEINNEKAPVEMEDLEFLFK